MKTVNLIPARLRDAACIRARARAWVAGGLIYAAVLGLGCLAVRAVGGQETMRLEVDGTRLTERLERAQEQLASIRAQVRDIEARLEASRTVGEHPDWSILLRTLAALREDSIVLDVLDLRAVDQPRQPAAKEEKSEDGKPKPRPRPLEAYTLVLRGAGLSQNQVMGFVSRLEGLAPLADVKLRQTQATTVRGVEAVSFTLECRLAERPAAPDGPAFAGSPSPAATSEPARASVESTP